MIFDFKEDKATEAQLSYIVELVAIANELGYHISSIDDSYLEELTKSEASELIDELKLNIGWS